MKVKFLFLLMAVLITLTVAFSGCGGTAETADPINETVTPAPLTVEGDSKLADNPDRGYRTEFVIYVKRSKKADEKYDARTVFVSHSEEEIRNEIQKIFNIYIYNRNEQAKLSLSYIYITDWREKELDDEILSFFRIYFTMCREQKIKNMLRVCYCTSSTNRDEGADEKTIVRHTKQLAPVISEFADTIHTISCGFVGAYGEWAKVYQYPEVDYATVIKAIVENLAVPNDLYFSIRSPAYKNLVGKDYEHYWSISHNNDALYGQQNRGWNSGGYEVGTPEWEQVTREGAYTPQGGEMFVNGQLIGKNQVPVGWEVILECYYHRHTSLSFWHGYLDEYKQDNVMKRWQDNEVVTPEMLDEEGMVYDPYWFKNANGETATRNPYEFLRDHLGYRLVAKDVTLSWSGKPEDKLTVSMNMHNYGFAAAFNMQSGFAILDKDLNVVSEVSAGEPKTWYNRDPENAYSNVALTHNVTAELAVPEAEGEYYVAFYLKNTMGTTAALANDIPYQNGFNILYSLKK